MPKGNPKGNPQYLMPPWKKGQSGNPKGRPKMRADLKEIKLMSKQEMRRLIQKIVDMTPDEMRALSQRKDVPALEMMLASVAYQAIRQGDQSKISFLLDRTIGKVSDKADEEAVDIVYKTEIQEDGTLLQQIHEEEKAGDDKKD